MLGFVQMTFRGFFEVILWINLIVCTVGMGIIAEMTYSVNRYGASGIHPILGGFIGFIIGMLINIVGGGIIATLLNMDENLEQLRMKMHNNNSSSAGGTSSGINLSDVSPVNRNYGETWVCKKCNERNPIASSSCKSCGEYK